VDAELEVLHNSAARILDLVLGVPVGTSSLAASLSSAAKLIEDWVNAAAANGIH
jgi:hypothetical protein